MSTRDRYYQMFLQSCDGDGMLDRNEFAKLIEQECYRVVHDAELEGKSPTGALAEHIGFEV